MNKRFTKLPPAAERLTPQEVARELGVHTGTVFRWMFGGVRGQKLPFFRIGNRRFISSTILQEFLDACNDGRQPNPAIEGDLDSADSEIDEAKA